MQSDIEIIKSLKASCGLYRATPSSCLYQSVWLRDCFYMGLGLEKAHEIDALENMYHSILNILCRYEEKIDSAIKHKPIYSFQYIHPRYNVEGYEYMEKWGNSQNDAIGAILYGLCDLHGKGYDILNNRHSRRIAQKLVWYLESVEYWHDEDYGMWEDMKQVHISSIGACVAGLRAARKLSFLDVNYSLIDNGIKEIDNLLKDPNRMGLNLNQLSLIYPYNLLSEERSATLADTIAKNLERNRGIIRYKNDQYYSNGKEAEWCFGLPWLAIIYRNLGDYQKYGYYMEKSYQSLTSEGYMPELYYSDSAEYNENTPLGWAQTMYYIAKEM